MLHVSDRRLPGSALVALSLLLTLGATSAAAQTITVRDERPRVVFRPDGTPGARTFQSVRDRYNADGGDNPFRSEFGSWVRSTVTSPAPVAEAARYVITGDEAHARAALEQMASGTLSYSSMVEDGIQWALAYDWVHAAWGADPPADVATQLSAAEAKIAAFTLTALGDLDVAGQSMWHRRAAIGAAAWVTAVSLPAGNATYDGYRERAWAHWQQTLKALHASQGWPEGPTYWATHRAVTFPIAWMAYESAVADAPEFDVADPAADLRAAGLWQAYTERGDGSFNRYGDISSQVTIGNGTIGRSIDLYAAATGDPALAAFARYARRYRNPLYHSSYQWIAPISFDSTLPKPEGYDPADPGGCLADALPDAHVFGRDGLGLAVVRQGWADGDTQISFKAGDYLTHHAHATQGTFTIFKHAPLVINSGGYGPYTGDHRLNYYVRSVAANTIGIQRPGEAFTPSGGSPPGGYTNDGGQRIIGVTGSYVRSIEQWEHDKTAGPHYETGDITRFSQADGQVAYLAADITRAYNSTWYDAEGAGGKVSRVTRSLVYLHESDALIVFDRVRSTDPAYRKAWRLHTPTRFDGGDETAVRGSADDGITVTDGSTIPGGRLTMTNGPGRLFLDTVLPADFTATRIGGSSHRYYVEDDGDVADGRDGSNHDGYDESSWHDYGNWRIEISPADAAEFDTFLVVLAARDAATETVADATLLADTAAVKAVRFGTEVVAFGTEGQIPSPLELPVPAAGEFTYTLADAEPGRTYRVTLDEGEQLATADQAGLLRFDLSASAAGTVSIEAVPDSSDGDSWEISTRHGGVYVSVPISDGDVVPTTTGPRTIAVALRAPADPATVSPASFDLTGLVGGDLSSLIVETQPLADGSQITLTLAQPLPDGDRYTLAATDDLRRSDGTAYSGGVSLEFGVLAGDIDASGTVTEADLLTVRGAIGLPVDAASAWCDVEGSGAITTSDLLEVRSRLGGALP